MQGEREKECLNRVKKAVFYQDNQLIHNPFSNQTYKDASDEDFKRERNFFVNSEWCKCCFGLLESERTELEDILRTVKANPTKSAFPDFLFDHGFIEHFQITSSAVTKKGSVHIKRDKEFRQRVDAERSKFVSECSENLSLNKPLSKSWDNPNPKHSYKFLVESFKRNWESHMKSYRKYDGSKQIGIFMIEHPELALKMCEEVCPEWENGMSCGDLKPSEKFCEYRLSRDKNLLEYVYQFKNEIKYVLFVNQCRVEVIRTENIPYLITRLPWNYEIYPLDVTTSISVDLISMEKLRNQGDAIDD